MRCGTRRSCRAVNSPMRRHKLLAYIIFASEKGREEEKPRRCRELTGTKLTAAIRFQSEPEESSMNMCVILFFNNEIMLFFLHIIIYVVCYEKIMVTGKKKKRTGESNITCVSKVAGTSVSFSFSSLISKSLWFHLLVLLYTLIIIIFWWTRSSCDVHIKFTIMSYDSLAILPY